MISLIISDLHLGSRSSQVGPLEQILDTHFDQLILNGDTINNLNLKKLKPKHWRIMDRLREIARRRELILIRGNHDVPTGSTDVDFGPSHVLSSLLGVRLQEDHPLKVGSQKYLICHGDRFDPTLRWPMVTDAADLCYRTVQGVNRKAAKWLKHSVKRMGGAVQFVKRRSVEFAHSRELDGIITGHTHFGDDEQIGSIHYLNTGCWVDWPCTYITATPNHLAMHHWTGTLSASAGSRSRLFWPRIPAAGFRRVNGTAASSN